MESAPVKRRKRDGQWAAYEAGVTKPRDLEGHNEGLCALAVGLDGKVYSGSNDKTIRVWSPVDSTHLQTLVGHTDTIFALVVGTDGKVLSGSSDGTIRVWSSVNGALLHTPRGDLGVVSALAFVRDRNLYCGGNDARSGFYLKIW